jgi:crossover junction endodeoxyribonuclease RuvC
MPSRVLAIDPGFDRVGVALMEEVDQKPHILYSECISTNAKDTRAQRLLAIGLRLKELIKKWHPEVLAIETLFFNQNISSGLGVAEARGVIIYESSQAGLGVYEYSPQSVKIATTSYGKASKHDVNTMVRRLISLSSESKKLDDEIDAIAVGITHLASKKNF